MDDQKQPGALEAFYDPELKRLLQEVRNGDAAPTPNAETLKLRAAWQRFQMQLFLARREKGWTQQQLAEAANMPQSTVARIEAGRTMPSVLTVIKLASVLEMRLVLQHHER